MYELNYKGSEVDEAVGRVLENGTKWDSKQDALTGQEGQVVGFNADGEPVAQDAPSGLPDGGTTGQVLTRSGTSAVWKDVPKELPELGSFHQILSIENDNLVWRDETTPIYYIDVTKSGGVYSTDSTWMNITVAIETYNKLPVVRTGNAYTHKLFLPFYIPAHGTEMYFCSVNALNIEIIVLNKTDFNFPPTVIYSSYTALEEPEGGTTGQILTKTADGQAWQNPPASGMTQTEADARYLQLSGGTMTGDIEFSGGGNISRNYIEGANDITIEQPRTGSGTGYTRVMVSETMIQLFMDHGSGAERFVFTPSGLNMGNKPITNCPSITTPTLQTITLSASGWSSNQQTVTVSGIITDSTKQLVDVYPVDRDDILAWGDAKITANQPTTANQITFVCDSVPTQDISVAVVTQNV